MSKQATVTSIIPEFRGGVDDWNVYREILEEFYRANGISGEAKVPVLISVIGKDTYRTLRDLCHPNSPKEMDYESLCKVLARQFIPEIAIFRRRSKFYRAEQRRGESVKDWYARLKALSVECAFAEDQLEPLLLDRFVIGLTPGPVQDRLYEEHPDSMTLDRAVDLAATKEAAIAEDLEQNVDELVAEEFANLALGEEEGRHHRHRNRRHGKHGYHRFGVVGHHGHGHEHGHGHGRRHRHHHRREGPHSDREESHERHHHHRHHGPPHHRFGGPEEAHGHHEHRGHHRHHFGPPAFGHGTWHHGREMSPRHFGAPPFGPFGGRGHPMRRHCGLELPEVVEDFCRRYRRAVSQRSSRKWRKHCRRRRRSSTSSSSSSSSSDSTSSDSSASTSSVSDTQNEAVAEKREKKCHKMRNGGMECKRYGGKRHGGKFGKHHGHHGGRHHRHHHSGGEGSGRCQRRQRKHGGDEEQTPGQPEEASNGVDQTTEPELID